MSGYARFSSQEAANINTFGSGVKDAIVLPEDDGFVVRPRPPKATSSPSPAHPTPPRPPPSGFCAPDRISNKGSTMRDHYHVIDYEDGRRLEALRLAKSTVSTRPGFLRLFYSLNPKATRRYFGVPLHDDGAYILHGDGRTATSFMRVRSSELRRWQNQ